MAGILSFSHSRGSTLGRTYSPVKWIGFICSVVPAGSLTQTQAILKPNSKMLNTWVTLDIKATLYDLHAVVSWLITGDPQPLEHKIWRKYAYVWRTDWTDPVNRASWVYARASLIAFKGTLSRGLGALWELSWMSRPCYRKKRDHNVTRSALFECQQCLIGPPRWHVCFRPRATDE